MNPQGPPILPTLPTHPLGDAEEKFLLDLFGNISSRLRTKYQYSNEEFFRLWEDQKPTIPAAIFATQLSPAEAIAKYLKENCQLSYSQIANHLARDEKSIWCNYARAQKKMPHAFSVDTTITLPLTAFSENRSTLESVILYLKDVKQLSNAKIAKLLGKQPSNVWTIHKRAKGKVAK